LDKSTHSIKFTTSRAIQAGEELCIFYAPSHKLWFADQKHFSTQLSRKHEVDDTTSDVEPLERLNLEDNLSSIYVDEVNLPFEELRYMEESDDDTEEEIQTSTVMS
jgi:hypothetical protein